MKTEVISLLEGIFDVTLTAYLQEPGMDQIFPIIRPAVVLCPGGAYMGMTEKEGEPVALKFLAQGYHVFILKYSVGIGTGQFPAPFIDAARAIKLIRENAKRWFVDPGKIALCGFSAGGHVAAMLAATWHEDYLSEALHAENHLFKPDALILGYPLLDMYAFKEKNKHKMQPLIETMFMNTFGTPDPSEDMLKYWSCIGRVTKQMPKTFLWTTLADEIVDVKDTFEFARLLSLHEVPFELHIFEKGPHGLSLADENVGYNYENIRKNINVHQWMDMAVNWLKHSE